MALVNLLPLVNPWKISQAMLLYIAVVKETAPTCNRNETLRAIVRALILTWQQPLNETANLAMRAICWRHLSGGCPLDSLVAFPNSVKRAVVCTKKRRFKGKSLTDKSFGVVSLNRDNFQLTIHWVMGTLRGISGNSPYETWHHWLP